MTLEDFKKKCFLKIFAEEILFGFLENIYQNKIIFMRITYQFFLFKEDGR